MDIKIQHVSFGYDDVYLLHDLNLTIKQGERICFMGPSGCGKTTILQLISGILTPKSGQVSGVNTKRISMVFQENRLCEPLSAKANLQIGLLRGAYNPNKEHTIDLGGGKLMRQSFLDTQLKEVGICTAEKQKVSSFSGGMKRRVAILRAMLSDSELVIMDEPFQGLDEKAKREVITYIDKHLGDRTFILVTHDKAEAMLLGCRIEDVNWISM